ncbi:hypothetical protein [Cyanobium sp. ATX 6F1]|uniref:hypothetical protein n=1 Tax=unclassified Cyanobium TaxID=2627006 RepID=UPI0020CEFE9E|nr:hypothetical protein [Cyanobium sp. ATX 6F1]MCP9915770.1 hypothetical protein [Cyanobium sp. ATX 6F1]
MAICSACQAVSSPNAVRSTRGSSLLGKEFIRAGSWGSERPLNQIVVEHEGTAQRIDNAGAAARKAT